MEYIKTLNLIPTNKYLALFEASKDGCLEIIRYLLDFDERLLWILDVASSHAISYVQIPTIQFFLDCGLTIQPWSLLKSGVFFGQTRLIQLALDQGAEPSSHNNYLMIHAVIRDNPDVVRLLLEAGVENNVLSYAVRNGKLENVKILLEFGADLSQLDREYLDEAQKNGHTEMVQFVLDNM
jgi:ankyrin repeat protein